jgi:hypothetical protein
MLISVFIYLQNFVKLVKNFEVPHIKIELINDINFISNCLMTFNNKIKKSKIK